MTALAPFTGGLSLTAVPIISHYTAKKAKKERKYRASRDISNAMVFKFNEVIGTLQTVIAQTNSIVDIIGHFQVFWDERVDEIELLVDEFEEKKTRTLKYNKLSAKPVINKWEAVRSQYTSYSTNIRYLLNNSKVNRRIGMD